jgi:SnoaL-like polyketide cyclase
MPPLPKKRMPPKVRAYRAKMRTKNEGLQELVEKHIHSAHDGTLEPDTPAEASSPPFPRIPGLSDVRLQLDSQFMRRDLVATRWTVYAIHSGPVAGIAGTNLEINVTGLTVSRLTDDETAVASHESFYDQPALMQQLRMGS